MTTLAPGQTPSLVEPRPRRWTKEEYHQMGELGWFEDQHVELLDGEIVEMPVPGNPHCVSTDNVYEVLRGLFPKESHWVRMQMPLNLGLDTEPQPDVAVVAGAKTSFTDHPTAALLVVEVSDTTLSIDRGRKGSLYARAGISDYWIVNLVNRQLEIYRNPMADPTAAHGFRYADVSIGAATEDASPLAAPLRSISVAVLLPCGEKTEGSVMSVIEAPLEMVEAVAALRLPPKADSRLQVLMDGNTSGLLTPAEREELEGLVELSETIALVRAKALHLLGRKPA